MPDAPFAWHQQWYAEQNQALGLGTRVHSFSANAAKLIAVRKTKMSKNPTTWKQSKRFIPVQFVAWLLLAALLIGIVCFALFRSQKVNAMPQVKNSDSSAPISFWTVAFKLSDDGERGITYRYSVIPGGVRSIAELKNALARDPVVAEHYAGFQLASLRVVRLDRTRSLHVSYRIGDRIYWTKGRMNLAAGETVITDGMRMARSRCGNLAAEEIPAGAPTLPFPSAPAPEELDTPSSRADIPVESAPIGLLLPLGGSSISLPIEGGQSPSGGTIEGTTGGATGGAGGGHGSPGPSGTPDGGPAPATPPVSVPEPGGLGMVLIGLAMLVFLRKRASINA